MRAYLFDVESGLFSGEAYCDPAEVREEDGITGVPPPGWQTGWVPVYDRTTGSWKLVPIEEIEGIKHV